MSVICIKLLIIVSHIMILILRKENLCVFELFNVIKEVGNEKKKSVQELKIMKN